MGRRELVSGVMVCVVVSACSRTATLNAADVRALNADGERGIRVDRTSGEPLRFESYDSLELETKSNAEHEFEHPVRARVSADSLLVQSGNRERRVAIAEVTRLTLRERAPDRGWIILAAAGAGLVGGGLLGAAAYGGCREGEDFCGQGQGAAALLGATLGLGLGISLSIPLTAHLSPVTSSAVLAAGP